MTGILLLQDQYLKETNSAAKEKTLSVLYTEVVKLGKFLAQIKHFSNDIDDIYDIASDICCRLIETQEPVIKSAPSAYISSAIYFKNKSTFHSYLDDLDESLQPSDISTEEEVIKSIHMKDKTQDYIDFILSITTDGSEVQELAINCLLDNISCKDIKKDISDQPTKKEFNRVMKQLKQRIQEDINNAQKNM